MNEGPNIGKSPLTRRRILVGISALLVGIGAGFLTGRELGQSEPAPAASGDVGCADGQPVTGIWVASDEESEAGWAKWTAYEGDPSRASFSRFLLNSDGYEVHVGCGGTPDAWATASNSTRLESGKPVELVCNPVADAVGACAIKG